jgi:hypothetical protein
VAYFLCVLDYISTIFKNSKSIEQNKVLWKYNRKCVLGIRLSLYEKGGGDEEADREHEHRQDWVPSVRTGLVNAYRFRRLRKQKQMEKDLIN